MGMIAGAVLAKVAVEVVFTPITYKIVPGSKRPNMKIITITIPTLIRLRLTHKK